MRCSAFRRRVVALADGELPERLAQEMAAHAVSCAACAAELASVRQEGARYAAALWRHRAPADLSDRVMQAVADLEPAPGGWRGLLRSPIPVQWVYSVAGAAAVLVFVAMGLASRSQWAAPAGDALAEYPPTAQLYWAQVQNVQAAEVAAAPSGGPIYRYRKHAAASEPSRVGAPAVLPIDYTAPAINQSEPSVELQEMGPAGTPTTEEMKARNDALGAPAALTRDEQRGLNARSAPAAGPPGVMVRPVAPGARAPVHGEMLERSDVIPGPEPRPESPPVRIDSTDASVILTVGYRQEQERYVTTYTAAFEAKYTVRAPEMERKGLRIAVSFPFPDGCSTVTGPKLLVDDQEDEAHTSYSIAGIRWVGWFKPKEAKVIAVAYNARGEGSYVYTLAKNRLSKRFRLLMKVQGLEPGHEVEIPSEALQPNPTSAGTPGGWQYVWDHDGLLTMRDIIVNFPAKESPTAFAERVSAKAVEMLPVARLAPLFLALYLAALYLTGLPRTDRRRTIETLGLLALAFLAFYPLFVFGSAYLGRGPALWTALAITAGLSALYALSAGGASLAGRSALLQAVLLGAFTYACLDRALTGIIITAGVVVLLGCVMASSARRLRETP